MNSQSPVCSPRVVEKMSVGLSKTTINPAAPGSDPFSFHICALFIIYAVMEHMENKFATAYDADRNIYTSDFPWLGLGNGCNNRSKSSRTHMSSVLGPSIRPIYNVPHLTHTYWHHDNCIHVLLCSTSSSLNIILSLSSLSPSPRISTPSQSSRLHADKLLSFEN